ncbi:MAG: pyruvate, phosphate dikinase [SAR324 cluster bacterium]|nr:pyruvate, phosphate dikinase [SAR324 cluster bacterium]
MAKRVYLFNEGSKDDRQLLGGKGANLCEMTNLGLPVPFGFIVTTPTCNDFFDQGKNLPDGLMDECRNALKIVEDKMGAQFGNPDNPLLFSVRSGAPISMPGMMNTILNLGLNDEIAEGMAKKTNNPRFAYDSYRRFIQMFADVVLEVDNDKFEEALDSYKESKGYKFDVDMQADDWKALVKTYKTLVDFPTDPFVQLELAIKAVFESWFTPRAGVYREMNRIPDTLGTAVNIQSMVFGNFGDDSGSGVCFTRNPSNGDNIFYGEFLTNAAGEDVVAGTRTPEPIENMKTTMPQMYEELYAIQDKLEKHYRDMQDMEFTIQESRLYILQTRSGKRTGRAAVKTAVDMVAEGLIDEKEALMRVEPGHIDAFLHPMIDPNATRDVIAKGLPASPGGATGHIVYSADEAVEVAETGKSVILVRRETTPEDIHGMKVAAGILTELGGMTSHAAVVARGMGVCAITGCDEIKLDYAAGTMKAGGKTYKRGDVITLDGSTGEVMEGDIPKVEASGSEDFQTLLGWADKYRRLKIRANAETPEDAGKARELGAEGIGLCRTEHMFFDSSRIDVIRSMILSETKEERQTHLDKLFEFQKEDMKALFKTMEGFEVTIRLLDPPLHEFLPHNDDEISALSGRIGMSADKIKEQVTSLHEFNPMLGFRGCRLAVVYPEITRMQAQAIITAAIELQEEGLNVIPEIMIPLVVTVREIRMIAKNIDESIKEVLQKKGVSITYRIGTMIETPRASLTAHRIAPEVEFMSFGTNDLTQMTFGFSRDDIGKFLPDYLGHKILDVDPFVSVDPYGVGRLVKMTIEDSSQKKAGLKFGICGEHGGDPHSIQFFHDAGLNYVSCSPFRVPVARVAAAQANLRSTN